MGHGSSCKSLVYQTFPILFLHFESRQTEHFAFHSFRKNGNHHHTLNLDFPASHQLPTRVFDCSAHRARSTEIERGIRAEIASTWYFSKTVVMIRTAGGSKQLKPIYLCVPVETFPFLMKMKSESARRSAGVPASSLASELWDFEKPHQPGPLQQSNRLPRANSAIAPVIRD